MTTQDRYALDKTSDLEKVLGSTPFMLTRCSRDLRYLYVSKAYAAMVGRRPDEIAGKRIIDILGPRAFEAIHPHVEEVLRGERVEYEAEIPYGDARPRKCRVIYVPDRGEQNRVIGWIASIIDVTDKEATAEREQLEKLAAEMGIGIWHLDKLTNTVTWTRQLEEIYGLEASKVKSYEDFRSLVHPDDVQEMERVRDEAIRARKSMQFEFRIIRPDGDVRWVMGVARVIYDEVTGKPVRTIGTNVDITARKNAEQQADSQGKEIAHLMRVATLAALSGGIAHELGQPLASILASAQAAQTMLANKQLDDGTIGEILEEIVQEDIRAGEVVHRLRRLLKKGQTESALINLNDKVASTLRLLHSELVSRKIRVETELSADLPLIRGDRIQLQQVLLNLMMNAMDAMASTPPSRRTLRIATRTTEDSYVEVSVRDSGPGVSAENLERLFEPFFTTKTSGLGLGLSICSAIVRTHHGQLTLSNASDGGAIAIVLLPVALASSS